jgi:transposase
MAKKLGIPLAGCMAHLRRKLRKAMLAKDPRATEAIALIQGLYRIERLARLQGLDANGLLTLRRARAVPLMAALERWAHTVAPSVETGSPLGKAWTYLNNQWDCLQTYLSNPAVNIDNNAAERALRRITIGRKLWLFFRGNDTFERAARIASLLATARLHGADERRYIEWLLGELARREWSPAAAARLLPEAWLAAQEKKAEEVASVEV